MKQIIVFTLLFALPIGLLAQQQKTYYPVKHFSSIKIDGKLDDEQWKNIAIIDDFIQYDPLYLEKPTQKTEVKIFYTDDGIFVGAMLYDTAPDSILRQLGDRDDDLNADFFSIGFDTYNKQADAFVFKVYASGVQMDYRHSDYTYDAVWESGVNINDNGWSLEMKIPYAALRFPKSNNQDWGMQIARYIRRNRELHYWSPPVKGAENSLVYEGVLKNIENISSPLRLFLIPYVSANVSHYPSNQQGVSDYAESFSGGLDLKYGINDAFTLDMTLLPDFSQVQSDQLVKNVSAFETVYGEQRPFFKEAVDLFSKGDLFYSRRIGRTPSKYYAVYGLIDSTERIEKNPSQAKLLNATKLSGRNSKGLAFGLFNAVTGSTYADVVINDSQNRKILTEPLSNYNIIVLDKTYKNNSSVYLINTQVIRSNIHRDANVTGTGFNLVSKNNLFRLSGDFATSRKFIGIDSIQDIYNKYPGYRYNARFAKIKGNFQFLYWNNTFNPYFDANDMGLTQRNNMINNGIKFNYNIYQPFWILRNMYNKVSLDYTRQYSTKETVDFSLTVGSSGTFLNYLSFWTNFYQGLSKSHDYYETRTPGRYYLQPILNGFTLGLSSDYRKKLALDIEGNITSAKNHPYYGFNIALRPLARVSDKWSFNHRVSYDESNNDRGFVDVDTSQNLIFGNRYMKTISNTFTSKYIFMNDVSLSLLLRHYWSSGIYNQFFIVQHDGSLSNPIFYNKNANFNFNTFSVDLMFSWQFAPGSLLTLVWKNAILTDNNIVETNYLKNVKQTLAENQHNMLSLKVLYYLDYQSAAKFFSKA